MKTYLMTESETAGWESDDARVRDHVRHDVRAKAGMKTAPKDVCEIVSADGVVMDVVSGA